MGRGGVAELKGSITLLQMRFRPPNRVDMVFLLSRVIPVQHSFYDFLLLFRFPCYVTFFYWIQIRGSVSKQNERTMPNRMWVIAKSRWRHNNWKRNWMHRICVYWLLNANYNLNIQTCSAFCSTTAYIIMLYSHTTIDCH